MQSSDFHFDLPKELIAQTPLAERDQSRLLHLTPAGIKHRHFRDLIQQLQAGDLLVVNDTRVIPARLAAVKDSGGRVEILLERLLPGLDALCQVRASKGLKPGRLLLIGDQQVTVLSREGTFYRLRFPRAPEQVFEELGSVPLPPYIVRAPEKSDQQRYQTTYARYPGAVAAPTAGLHFSERLLTQLQARGVELAQITLHVGAGTFQPVRVTNLEEHRMHGEWFNLSAATVTQINACRARGGKVVAVGTTVVRVLESCADENGVLAEGSGETRLFIRPGYQFRVVDRLITNFHLPESTLLMLVAAFAGYERIMAAYRVAVAEHYRFFSYGDAMLLERLDGI